MWECLYEKWLGLGTSWPELEARAKSYRPSSGSVRIDSLAKAMNNSHSTLTNIHKESASSSRLWAAVYSLGSPSAAPGFVSVPQSSLHVHTPHSITSADKACITYWLLTADLPRPPCPLRPLLFTLYSLPSLPMILVVGPRSSRGFRGMYLSGTYEFKKKDEINSLRMSRLRCCRWKIRCNLYL